MSPLATLGVAGLMLLVTGNASALVLGRIAIDSAMGEPLEARIALLDLPEGGTEGVRARLGSPEQFTRAGLDRPLHLESLEFSVVPGGTSGRIEITGREAITVPFHFLVEAVGPRGRVLREYTVLPGTAVRSAAPANGEGAYGPVSETDTLWSIAARHRPAGISVQRMMLALLAANPQGFGIDNVNTLRAGAVLAVPEPDRIGPDAKRSAVEEVRRQNAAWQVYRETVGQSFMALPETFAGEEPFPLPSESGAREADRSGAFESELRVIAAGAGQAAGAGERVRASDLEVLRDERDLALEEADSTRREIGELSVRLAEAERLLSALRRLVELKDDAIVGLQRQLAGRTGAAEAPVGPAVTGDAAIARPVAPATESPVAPAVAEAVAPLRAEGDDREERSAEPDPADPATVFPPSPPGVMARLEGWLGFTPVVGGVGLVGVILILGGLIALIRRGHSLAGEGGEEGTTAAASAQGESAMGGFAATGSLPAGERADASRGNGAASRTGVDVTGGEGDGIDIGFDLGSDEDPRAAMESLLDDPEIGALEDEHHRPTFGREIAGDLEFDLGDPGERESRAADLGAPESTHLTPAYVGAGDSEREAGERAEGGDTYLVSSGGDRGEPDEEHAAFDLGRGAPDEAHGASGVHGPPPEEEHAAFGMAGDVPEEEHAAFGIAGDVPDQMDEAQTKLDLALAYLDIDDVESARGLLDEVLAGGNAEQRKIAGNLFGRIG